MLTEGLRFGFTHDHGSGGTRACKVGVDVVNMDENGLQTWPRHLGD
jgi:hypothetical protein